MRCERAQRWMAAAADGELSARRQRALDSHVDQCATCREELVATDRLLGALDQLSMEAAVPSRLEYATLRAVRRIADEPPPWSLSRWLGVVVPATAVVALSIVSALTGGPRLASKDAPAPSGMESSPKRTVEAPGAPRERVVARARRPAAPAPSDPPAELASAPDLFISLPILRDLEKFEHFDAIRTTTVDGELRPEEAAPESNG